MAAKTDKRRLLMIGNFLSRSSGARSVCEDLAERFSRAGWRVITTSAYTGRLRRLGDMLITTLMRRKDYHLVTIDVFSGAAFTWAEICAYLLHRLGKPFILVLHGGRLPEFANRHPRRVIRLLGSARSVVAPSRYLTELMQPFRRDILTIPNALDLSRYNFRVRSNPLPHLCWLRGFHSVYHPQMAVEVIASLVKVFPGIRLRMGGADRQDGSFDRTKAAAELNGVIDRIEFCGRIPNVDVPSWLQTGDIFLNTTNADNMPVSVLEAMACGLPVVSTRVGGIKYLLEDGVDALLVPPDDPDAMSAAVGKILTEPGLAGRLSRNGRIKVEQLNWDNIAPLWEQVLYQKGEQG